MKIHHLANSTQCFLKSAIKDLAIEFDNDEGDADPSVLEEILSEVITGLSQRLAAVQRSNF